MNRRAFDDLTKSLVVSSSRRSILAGAVVGALGRLGLQRAAAACKKVGRKCDESDDCCGEGTCKRGKCRCKGKFTVCRRVCTDTRTDRKNCGKCGRKCSQGQVCALGVCVTEGCLPYKRDGDTQVVDGGVRLRADSAAAEPFGALIFKLPGGSVDFDDISILSTQFLPEQNDGCRAGSPRFQLETDEGNVFVYPSPDNNCPGGLQDPGNLIGNNSDVYYDTSQLSPGTQRTTYDATQQLLTQLGLPITGISLVVDSAFAFPDGVQSIIVNPCVQIIEN